ncbi:cobaltochelatase subunit CobN [Methanothermobacter thermautotrophicus]|uniref:cobaltochelatase subunit CobN n=1 Tax=Methanothermobacter thermautotrophicus TaxID=145262 RepID=UPI00117AC775
MVPGHGLLWGRRPRQPHEPDTLPPGQLHRPGGSLRGPGGDAALRLYLPFRGFYRDLESYRRASNFNPELPTVGMLFYSGMHFDDTRPLVEELYSRLHGNVNCTVVFSDVENNLRAIEEYMGDVDLFVNMQYFQLNRAPWAATLRPQGGS